MPLVVEPGVPFSGTVYHGTVFQFDEFDLAYAGTLFGYGAVGIAMYFNLTYERSERHVRIAERKAIRKGYDASSLAPQVITVSANLDKCYTIYSNIHDFLPTTNAETRANTIRDFMITNGFDGFILYGTLAVYDLTTISITDRTEIIL